MLIPNYKITNALLKNVGRIDGAREVILNAPLVPAWEAKFRKEAMERTVHHGTHLEGNPLSEEEVKDVLDGQEVMARERDIQEILNYRNVLKFIDSIEQTIGSSNLYHLTVETILEMHRLTVEKTVPIEYQGTFRSRQVVIRNSLTGQVSYTPPPAVEVPFLIEDLVNWVNSQEAKDIHPVIKAGIVHYELARVHPFVDGNGRVARAVATLILFLEGYDIKKFFSLEEYFDSDPMNYYLTLQAVSNQLVLDTHERDLTPWLEYFCEGVAIELNRVKERVQRISVDARIKDKLGGTQLMLNERQMLIMEYLQRHKSLANREFRKIFPDHSDDTVLRELKFLRQKGLVRKAGGTKKATYVLK
ncbi:MAG: Fic family protein [Candidatus Daviesbacteria bacterium]|nr:MAG: Fic family protein [Candidatus Daviesbacteria bacterium]